MRPASSSPTRRPGCSARTSASAGLPPQPATRGTDVAALPVIDGPHLADQGLEVVAAARDPGAFYLANPPLPAGLGRRVLDAARGFFALPAAEKAAVHISRSPHFRGYS